MSEKKIYSTHHFMFPFRWDVLNNSSKESNKYDFLKRTAITEVDLILKNEQKWKRKTTLSKEDFNHYTYFFKHIRNTIYDLEYHSEENTDVVRYYEYDLPKSNKCYEIKFYEKKSGIDFTTKSIDDYDEKTIRLEIRGITLHLFKTGVGVLAFNLANEDISQSSIVSVLKINDFGRRIYPQFLNFNETIPYFNAQRVFHNKHIKLFDDDNFKEDWSRYNDIDFNKPILIPKFIDELFNSNQFKQQVKVVPIVDDRMFFISWYGNNKLAPAIGSSYKNSDWWYAYIFGDKSPKSIANDEMQTIHLIDHTYQRWSNYGTLYGMSRDSFVCLSNEEDDMIKNDLPNLRVHNDTIYYQIAILCLVQRATVLKFSSEVALLNSLTNNTEKNKISDKELTIKINMLYSNYIEFRNKIYFREITSQIQGIEIYQKFQQLMNLKEEVEDLDAEIEELHRYANHLLQQKQSEESHTLTVLASFYLPFTLIFGILGANFYSDNIPICGDIDLNAITWLIIAVVIGIIFFILPIVFLKSFKKLYDYLISKFN